MPKKKTKDPKQNAQTDVVLPPFGIFSTLFDNATEHVPTTANASASLFSDNNPFRRKPQQYTPISESPKSTQILNNGVSENHDYIDEKKRKRNKEEKNPTATADPDSLIEVSEKKNDKKKKKQASDEENKGSDMAVEPIGYSEVAKEDDETERKMKKKKKNQGSDEENKGSDLIAETTEKGESNYEGDERKKKKRKREELEKEWEEKKYGVMEGEVEGEGLEKKTVGSKRKALDNAADMLVSKEGFDDEDKLLRTVFVGNLPLKVKKKTLLKEFKKFGEVESVRIRSVPIQDTKKPKKGAILAKKINDDGDSVHAYIVFKTEESAQASLSHNMAVVEGNHIRVDRACPPRKKQKCESALLYDNKRTVFVGNLPFDVKEAANFVIRKRNLRLRDRTLRISHAKADATPSKRPYPSPVRAPSTPAKKMALGSRSPLSSDNRSDRKAKASYQGLHASKSDIQKKAHGGEKPKERLVKRPSVAARKAKANSHMDATPSKQAAGIKRKFDARTPDSSVRHKKFKRDR
ncbi:PREDICTED: nucleolar protein 12-like isoform X3 [Lupinus angustifolius]|uniref:nucleolar protein 12-like isoform X3 n=1 Tax=Lupinus angustifolius TaxID=3871 RepID=UPI00092E8306|nr:PREDICTED: nucleolar protein 12-like isoform X3 [Lupinus angustifolius]